MEWLWRDLRYGFRILRRKPGFAFAAILSLILGIGVNTAIFGLLQALFVHPLPVAEPERLVTVYQTLRGDDGSYSGTISMSYEHYQRYRGLESWDGFAIFQWAPLSLTGGTRPERVTGMFASGEYFDTLGVRPHRGRFFGPAETTLGGQPVAVLTHGCWQRLFGADEAVVDRQVSINGTAFTVLGVAPPGFKGTALEADVDVFLPVTMYPEIGPFRVYFDRRDAGLFRATARLAEGVNAARADAEIMAVAVAMEEEDAELAGLGATTRPLIETSIPGASRERLVDIGKLLTVAAALILLIACLNVANLLLARGLERRRELAVRRAIGAGRAKLTRQLLAETLCLFTVGGLLSLPVARWSLDFLAAFQPTEIAAVELGLDLRLIAFAFGITLACGLVVGLLPALAAANPDLVTQLKDSGAAVARGGAGKLRTWPRKALVAAQVALTFGALVAAGLFVHSLRNAQQIVLGFEHDKLLTVGLAPGEQGYDQARSEALYRQMLEEVRALEGVEAATLSENRLLRGGIIQRQVYHPGGEKGLEIGSRSFHRTNAVVPGYFRAVGIPLLFGRDFDASIVSDGPPVAIVNRTMAEALWPGEDPIGQRFHFDSATTPGVEVVGVAENAKYRELQEQEQFFVYVPMVQRPAAAATLHVRAAGDPAVLLARVRQTVQALDPELPLADVETMGYFVDQALVFERGAARLLAAMGWLGLVLAALGVYGVMAFAFGQRRRELSIRVSLGARRGHVAWRVLSEALVLIGGGLVLGLGLAFFVVRPLISSQLFGVDAGDPSVYMAQAALVLAVTLAGCALPVVRALRLQPMQVLRGE